MYISLTGRAPLLLDFKAIPTRREYEQSGRGCVSSARSRMSWEILPRGDTGRPGQSAAEKMTALEGTAAVGVASTLVGFAPALEWMGEPNVQLLVVPTGRLCGDCRWPEFCIMH